MKGILSDRRKPEKNVKFPEEKVATFKFFTSNMKRICMDLSLQPI